MAVIPVSKRNEAISRLLQIAYKAIEDLVDSPDRTMSHYYNETSKLLILVARDEDAERIRGYAQLTKTPREIGADGPIKTLKPQ